jgi:cell shape-determining protein MreC
MRKISYRPYVLLIFFLLSLMSLTQKASEKIRSVMVSSLSPCWRGLNFLKENTCMLAMRPLSQAPQNNQKLQLELERLNQENLLLRAQIENVREWLLYEDRLQELVDRLKTVAASLPDARDKQAFMLRRNRELSAQLDLAVESMPAKVIFRDPSSWSSSLWINVGEKENKALGKKVVAKGSPVLVGTTLVGVIEQVDERQSRVRLVTDSRLTPSVRAVRGSEQNRYLLEHLEALLFALEVRDDFVEMKREIKPVADQLLQLKQFLKLPSKESYLAKGVLSGCSSSHFRTRSQVLRGFGFNYDFADEEGPARDLRTGIPYDIRGNQKAMSILKTGDLLVTTGLDGVFPAGLRVAIVSKVQRLKEGASAYEIEASSTAGNLDELCHVFVLPPV